MEVTIAIHGQTFQVDLAKPSSIAINLDFTGPQPSHFGADPATAQPMRSGEFVGNVEQGGSCNVDVVTLNIHCNGTHTETVGHILSDSVSVSAAALSGFYAATVATVASVQADSTTDTYQPKIQPTDLVIDRAHLETVVKQLGDQLDLCDALVLRTLPNDAEKKFRQYGGATPTAFFTTQAMQLVCELGIKHLLVDLPSIDRADDDGLLSNHRIFWNVAAGEQQKKNDCWSDKTITEMIYVPSDIADGVYLLNLQVPAFASDAAPSRPILYPLRPS